MKKVNFLIVGGSGHFSELNHYPAILAMKDEGIDARVVAICDPQDPKLMRADHFEVGRHNLNKILAMDEPMWINPIGLTKNELKKRLTQIAGTAQINVVVVSCNPTQHYFYTDWAVSAGISVLCDKPLIVVPDSSWKPEQARLIEKRYQSLYKKVLATQKINPDFRLCIPLRRRVLSPFVLIADSLQSVFEQTGEGITYMNTIVNGGVHRYPVEFLKGGAHGFTDGVGSLSHSSYHYLDVIAWYLQCSPGNVAQVGITLTHVSRVRDYLNRQGYGQLLQINSENPAVVVADVKLPARVLNAELDFTIHLRLYDERHRTIGLLSYTSNHTTFSPRTTKYDCEMLDHANDRNGGRMSQIYMDIHQGCVQNWSLMKNDVVFEGNKIEVTQRLHPKLGESYRKTDYLDAYDSETVTLRELFVLFVKKCVGIPISEQQDSYLRFIDSQTLTHRIFSASYELIAENFVDPNSRNEIIIDIIKSPESQSKYCVTEK